MPVEKAKVYSGRAEHDCAADLPDSVYAGEISLMIESAQDHPPNDCDLLKAFLAQRDEACPVCKYSIRDLSSDTCPECGCALKLKIDSSDLHIVPWIVALLSAALPAGFYIIVSLVTIYFWMMSDF